MERSPLRVLWEPRLKDEVKGLDRVRGLLRAGIKGVCHQGQLSHPFCLGEYPGTEECRAGGDSPMLSVGGAG